MKNQEEVQPTNWQPYPPNNTYPANSYPAQPYAGQPYPAQPYPAQPYPAQPYGQPYPDQQGIPAAAPPSYENTITNTTSTTVIITDSHPESFHENDMFSFDSKSVRLGFIRKVASVSVMLFACQTKYDFTGCGGVLFVACISLLLFGIFAGIFVPSGSISIVNMVYAGLGALLFMGFLAYDTQLIMGGRKFEISPEDYVFAAMMLYIDIIYIFLFILSLIGGKN
eukprot:gene14482-5545_t